MKFNYYISLIVHECPCSVLEDVSVILKKSGEEAQFTCAWSAYFLSYTRRGDVFRDKMCIFLHEVCTYSSSQIRRESKGRRRAKSFACSSFQHLKWLCEVERSVACPRHSLNMSAPIQLLHKAHQFPYGNLNIWLKYLKISRTAFEES